MNQESLGDFLRHEREERQLSIEQVASATKIGVRLLHALESDHYAELPARTFVRGFVTSYARFLGLDTRAVLARFDPYIELRSAERPNREAGHSGYAFERKEGEQHRFILSIAIFSFLILGGGAMLILRPSLQKHKKSNIEKLQELHIPLPSPSPSPIPVVIPVPADPLDSGAGLDPNVVTYKLAFKMHEDVWVRYQIDDRPARKFIVRAGRALVLKAVKHICFQSSDAEALSVSVRGGSYVLMADHMQVTSTPSGIPTLTLGDTLCSDDRPFGPLPSRPQETKKTDQ